VKVFISMPMNGKTKEEIANRMAEIGEMLKTRFPHDKIEVLDSLIKDTSNGPVWCLGRSIMIMSHADLVVFDKDWRLARGCKVEFDVCSYYGFRFLEI